jgi:hypothetical protein
LTRRNTAYVLGFHGCDEDIGRQALDGLKLKASDEDHDWLGPGVYFWENDPQRAIEWAQVKFKGHPTKVPFSVGAMIDLGNCLDLTLRENFGYLEAGYKDLQLDSRTSKKPLPKNKDPRGRTRGDKLLRFLDCAVIRRVHRLIADGDIEPFDTVRGLFTEGSPVYPGARFYKKTHSQIAVLNHECIKAVFMPRHDDSTVTPDG